MRFARKFCYHLVKTAPERSKFMKESYKDKYFGEFPIFRWHGNFKRRHLSAELATMPGRPESIVNDRNVNTARAIFQ